MGDVPAEVGAFLQFTSVGQMYRLVLSWLRDDSHQRDWVWIALHSCPKVAVLLDRPGYVITLPSMESFRVR
jgi:hypothetical protein